MTVKTIEKEHINTENAYPYGEINFKYAQIDEYTNEPSTPTEDSSVVREIVNYMRAIQADIA